MSYTSPRTWVALEVLTASNMNTHVRDNLIAIYAGGMSIASQAANDIIYATSSTQLGRSASLPNAVQDNITRLGSIATFGGQLAFPASQNASAGANVLDDYEEFTWTPVIGGDGGTSGQAYSNQTGTGTKVGRQVCLVFDVTLSTKGTITGNVIISGFTPTPGSVVSGMVTYWASVGNQSALMLAGGSGVASAAVYTGGTSAAPITTSSIANTSRMIGFVNYHV